MTKKELLVLVSKIEKIDKNYQNDVENILNKKMKPKNSLGVLENIVIKLAGIYGENFKNIKKKCHIVAVADNGIIEEGVSSCPLEYTALVSEAMLNNIACIGIFCKTLNINLDVVNIGMKENISKTYKHFFDKNVMKGTKNFVKERAMSEEEVLKAIKVGIDLIEERKNFDIFSNGEMGIGNTTTSSAILYSLTKKDISSIVGRGGGLSDISLEKKKNIIIEACKKYNTFEMDIIDIISYVGGLDIACMLGMYISCALNKKMMLVDGFISAVAALLAIKINPEIKNYILFTHKSEEPGMDIILEEISEKTFLNMNMRLGEGTGAVLSYPIIDCAIEMFLNMKTPKEVYELFGREFK